VRAVRVVWEDTIKDMLKKVVLYQLKKFPPDKLDKELTEFLKQAEDEICEALRRNGAICYKEALREMSRDEAEDYVRAQIEDWKLMARQGMKTGKYIADLLSLSLEFRDLDKKTLSEKVLLFDKVIHAEHAAGAFRDYLPKERSIFNVDIPRIKVEVDREIEEILRGEKPVPDPPNDPPDPDLKDVIIEVLRQEGKPVPLFVLIDALKSEGYAQEDVEQALSELEEKGYVKKGRMRTLFGEEETVELIREPEEVAKLTEFVEEEKVELTPSEQRMLEALKRAFGVEEPEITEVDGTKTVIVEYRGEKINIAIGEVKKPELFEPLSLEGKIWYAKKSPALERLKRKLKGVEEKEIRRPTAGVTEYGALKRYEQAKEAIEFLKAMQKRR